jgi:hypothetical protein
MRPDCARLLLLLFLLLLLLYNNNLTILAVCVCDPPSITNTPPPPQHMISHFMAKILADKPDDTVAYAAHYFTDKELPEIIKADMGNPTTFGS